MLEFINTIPNNGLIYYTTIFNRERLLVTSARALGEVLVQKNYEFIKPLQLRQGIGRILGVGILLAEGDEHKVGRSGVARHTMLIYLADPTQTSHACVCVQTCERAISSLLVQVRRTSGGSYQVSS